MRTIDEGVLIRDLRATCVHEYGHAAVAKHFRVPGVVSIVENPDGGENESFVVGQFMRLCDPASERHARLIALAGTVAEELDRERGVAASEIFEALTQRVVELSDADAEHAGPYTKADVEDCAALVRSLWLSIDAAARLEAGRFLRTKK